MLSLLTPRQVARAAAPAPLTSTSLRDTGTGGISCGAATSISSREIHRSPVASPPAASNSGSADSSCLYSGCISRGEILARVSRSLRLSSSSVRRSRRSRSARRPCSDSRKRARVTPMYVGANTYVRHTTGRLFAYSGSSSTTVTPIFASTRSSPSAMHSPSRLRTITGVVVVRRVSDIGAASADIGTMCSSSYALRSFGVRRARYCHSDSSQSAGGWPCVDGSHVTSGSSRHSGGRQDGSSSAINGDVSSLSCV